MDKGRTAKAHAAACDPVDPPGVTSKLVAIAEFDRYRRRPPDLSTAAAVANTSQPTHFPKGNNFSCVP